MVKMVNVSNPPGPRMPTPSELAPFIAKSVADANKMAYEALAALNTTNLEQTSSEPEAESK